MDLDNLELPGNDRTLNMDDHKIKVNLDAGDSAADLESPSRLGNSSSRSSL